MQLPPGNWFAPPGSNRIGRGGNEAVRCPSKPIIRWVWDPTDDSTHGAQQLSFFNGYYDSWCYLPVLGFVSFNEEAEPHLCAAVLRPGNVTAAVGAVGLLRRLVRIIRNRFRNHLIGKGQYADSPDIRRIRAVGTTAHGGWIVLRTLLLSGARVGEGMTLLNRVSQGNKILY